MTTETSNARGEWVLVPRVPTEAMIDAWRDAPDIWEYAYAAMLAAAPQPPSAPVGVEGLARLLERIRDLLASLPVDCLGSGTDASGQPYPIRDEVIHGITKALSQQPAAVDEGFVSRLAEALTNQDWDVDPDGDGSGIAQLRAAVVAAQQQGGRDHG